MKPIRCGNAFLTVRNLPGKKRISGKKAGKKAGKKLSDALFNENNWLWIHEGSFLPSYRSYRGITAAGRG